MTRIKLLNIEVDNLTLPQVLNQIDLMVNKGQNAYVVTPNIDHLVRVEHDSRFRKVYDEASLILTDGQPLVWFARWFSTPIQEKVSGSDLFPALCKHASEKGYRMFFLGAADGVAQKAAVRLTRRFPGLQVVGTHSPSFNFENSPEELKQIVTIVRDAQPQLLITALGSPKQELFMNQFRDELPGIVSLGLGASIDFEAGTLKRAPRWMSDHGLEWLFRLFQQPIKIGKRVTRDIILIIPIIIKYGIRQEKRNK